VDDAVVTNSPSTMIVLSNLVCTTRFWNKLHQVRSKSKDWKAK